MTDPGAAPGLAARLTCVALGVSWAATFRRGEGGALVPGEASVLPPGVTAASLAGVAALDDVGDGARALAPVPGWPAAAAAAPVVGPDGEPLGLVVAWDAQERAWSGRDLAVLAEIGRGVGAAWSADCAAHEREAQYRAVVESSPDAIGISIEGQLVYVNPAAGRLLAGGRGETLIGRTIFDLAGPAEQARVAAVLGEFRDGRQEPADLALMMRRLDGTPFDAEVSVIPFRRGGRPAAQVIVRDVTARHTLEEQVRRTQKLDALGRLAGGVAHDFNNQLTVIVAYAQLLRDGPCAEEAAEIGAAAQRAAALTRQLLAFGRRQLVEPCVLDLNHVVGGLEPMLGRLMGEQVSLSWRPSPLPLLVRADQGQLEQMLVNLALNARDAMADGGRLTIATRLEELDGWPRPAGGLAGIAAAGRWAVLTVADSGSGMDAATRARVFEPFFTTKAEGEGTGLGLAIVHGVVTQAGGHVWLESAPGSGTTIEVLLPVAEEQAIDDGRSAVVGSR